MTYYLLRLYTPSVFHEDAALEVLHTNPANIGWLLFAQQCCCDFPCTFSPGKPVQRNNDC